MPEPLPDTPPYGVPPALEGLRHNDWTVRQADLYADWFFSQIPGRLESLAQLFAIPEKLNVAAQLDHIGSRVVPLLHAPSMYVTQPGTGRLSEFGRLVLSDVGLLIAERLVANTAGKVQWVIYRGKGMPRNAMSRNMPVLENTVQAWHVDPFVTSMTRAYAGHNVFTNDEKRWTALYRSLRSLKWV